MTCRPPTHTDFAAPAPPATLLPLLTVEDLGALTVEDLGAGFGLLAGLVKSSRDRG